MRIAPVLAVLALASASAAQEADAYRPRTRLRVLAAAYESGTPVRQALDAEPPMPELGARGAELVARMLPRAEAIQSPEPATDCAAMTKEIDEVTGTLIIDEELRPKVSEMYRTLKGCGAGRDAVAFWTREREYRRDGFAAAQKAQRDAYEHSEKVRKWLAGVNGSVFGAAVDPGSVGDGRGPGGGVVPGGTVTRNGAGNIPPSAYLPSATVPSNFRGGGTPPPLNGGGNPAVTREVNRVLAIGNQSVCRLNKAGLRSVGSGSANGFLNNTLSTFTDKIRCYPQAEEVVKDMRAWGIGGPSSPWKIEIRNKEGWKPANDAEANSTMGQIKDSIYNNGHWWVRLTPKDPNALPVVVNFDPWAGIYSVDPPGKVKPRDQWQTIPTADQKDCSDALPKSS